MMKGQISHWSRDSQSSRRNNILRFTVRKPHVNFGELKRQFPVSPATLSSDLRYLESKNRIEHYMDSKRRNVRRYRPTRTTFDLDRTLEVADFLEKMGEEKLVTLRIDEAGLFLSLLLSGIEEENVSSVRKKLMDRWGERSGLRGRVTMGAAKIFKDFCHQEKAKKGLFIIGVDLEE